MSISVLRQVYDESRRLAIAGSAVAPGDFRLKKLLPQLERAGKKAPVFAKVAEAADRLIESGEKTSAAALLDLTTLASAILYTQGETGVEGDLIAIETVDLGLQKTQASARILKPLQDALTTPGSGRFEIIRDAYERGAFLDLRLIKPALAAIDDTYSEIADFVAKKILPIYSRAIVLELRATFDPKGRSGHARRLFLMHQLDPKGTRDLVRRSLDDGSKEVRIAAIGCLGDSPDDLPFLLEQVKARAKDVRQAALRALSGSDSDDAVKVLCAAVESANFAIAVEPLRASRNRKVTAFVLEAAKKQFDALITSETKDKKKLGKQNERMCLLLDCLGGRTDKNTEKLLLEVFAHTEQLSTLTGEPSGKDVVERLVSIMTSGSPKVQSALIEAHGTLPAESLGQAFIAACRCRKPEEVFKLFSPYLTAKIIVKRRSRDSAHAKREAIIELLLQGQRGWYYDPSDFDEDEFDVTKNLDARWLDLAVKLGRADLVQALAVPGHAKANIMLSKLFKQQFGKTGDNYELFGILATMIRVAHPDATDATIQVIMKRVKSKSGYYYYWLGHLIPRLPKKEAIPKLEAILPKLPEKVIDQLVDFITELKNAS